MLLEVRNHVLVGGCEHEDLEVVVRQDRLVAAILFVGLRLDGSAATRIGLRNVDRIFVVAGVDPLEQSLDHFRLVVIEVDLVLSGLLWLVSEISPMSRNHLWAYLEPGEAHRLKELGLCTKLKFVDVPFFPVAHDREIGEVTSLEEAGSPLAVCTY